MSILSAIVDRCPICGYSPCVCLIRPRYHIQPIQYFTPPVALFPSPNKRTIELTEEEAKTLADKLEGK